MDKKRAVELLKQALNEISHLRMLNLNNKEFDLWHNKVLDILEEAFGKTSTEWERFARAVSVYLPTYTNADKKKEYNRHLDEYETALKSIIQKYEILGIESEPTTPAETAKIPQDKEQKAATRELELVLEGNPDMILECIRSTTEKLTSQGHTYSFRRTSGRPDYAKWDKTYFAICAISQGDEGQIGTIKLQLLPKEKTSFKYLEPKNWTSSFGYFLNSLFAEFKKLGFVDLAKEKPIIKTEPQQIARRHKLWRWAKNNKLWSILIVGIPVLAALIYVIDYIWKLFSK